MTAGFDDSIGLIPETVTEIIDCMVSSGKVVHCFEEILVGKERYEITVSDHKTMVIKKYTDDLATMSTRVETREYEIYEDGTIEVLCIDKAAGEHSEVILNLDNVSESMAFLLCLELDPILRNLKEEIAEYW